MKRNSAIIVLVFVAVCLFHGWQRLNYEHDTQIRPEGDLSDIAQEVVAIPLQSADGTPIREVRDLYKNGDNLFLISHNTLYRFNRKGEFVCSITNPAEIRVAGYMVDAVKEQLIVLGNVDDIHYYDFEGNLLSKKKLKKNLGQRQLLSAILYRNQIYTIERKLEKTADEAGGRLRCEVGVYDTAFNRLGARPLVEEELTHTSYVAPMQNLTLSVRPDSGEIYAYAFPYLPDDLLRDSLAIARRERPHTEAIPLYPVQLGSRFWLAYNRHAAEETSRYLYCWDSVRNRAWQMAKGFEDDFYHTGHVATLEPMDLSGSCYFYQKSGEEVAAEFPGAKDSTVVFLVNLKG